jgi:2-dehydro-3-deoxy-D-arabinonate dehydratase
LALLTNAFGEVIAAAICNDVSSRSIEGENPLYLPQAKIYAGSCALGPGWTLVEDVAELGDRTIAVDVSRTGESVWKASTSTGMLHRRLLELVEWLHRADWFPHGAVLSTGTGVVPDLDFSLEGGDQVTVTIEGLGALANSVVVGRGAFGHLPRLTDYPQTGAPA